MLCLQTIYNISFFLLINVIVLNGLVLAIIMNRFNERREEQAKIVEDQKSTCFMCDITRPRLELDRTSLQSYSFDQHITRVHNV